MVKFHLCRKNVINGTMYNSSYLNIYHVIGKARSRSMQQNFHQHFFSTFESNISNLYYQNLNLSLAYQTICNHMFSYPKSDHIFSHFWLRTWLIFFFFLYVEIFHLLRRWEGVVIYCKLIPD